MVLQVQISQEEMWTLHHCVLDLNGTISQQGRIVEGLTPLIVQLQKIIKVYLLSADTRGTAQEIANQLGITFIPLSSIIVPADFLLQLSSLPASPTILQPVHFGYETQQKAAFVMQHDPMKCVAIGNGRNDVLMLHLARLGIGIIGAEGIARDCLLASDVVMSSPLDALRLLLDTNALKATLRS